MAACHGPGCKSIIRLLAGAVAGPVDAMMEAESIISTANRWQCSEMPLLVRLQGTCKAGETCEHVYLGTAGSGKRPISAMAKGGQLTRESPGELGIAGNRTDYQTVRPY